MGRVRRAITAAVAALALLGAPGCGGSLRSAAVTTLNGVAAVANSEGDHALDALCASELRAIGHTGHRAEDHCVRDDAPRAASDGERRALVAVRAQWAPVLDAYEALASAHDAARAVLEAGDRAASGDVLAALAALSDAYARLIHAGAPLGLRLPELLGGH